MKLFDLYKEWMETGTLGEPSNFDGGLCNAVPEEYQADLKLFVPDDWHEVFWAYELKRYEYKRRAYDFTPLRQTIVLLICAMKDEI
jgi:hypothetical protein